MCLGIDGPLGAGKTSLADILAAEIGVRCVHLDDLLAADKNGFVAHLDYPALVNELGDLPVIIEGVCLLQVLERVDLGVDLLVYVDSPRIQRTRTLEPVEHEVSEYRERYLPREKASIVFRKKVEIAPHSVEQDSQSAIDIEFIKAKTWLSIALVAGGILTLLIGLVVLLHGVTGEDHTIVRFSNVEISASGIGGVIMLTSVLWAFVAYKARPVYSSIRQKRRKFDSMQNLIEEEEYRSATAIKCRSLDVI